MATAYYDECNTCMWFSCSHGCELHAVSDGECPHDDFWYGGEGQSTFDENVDENGYYKDM